MPRRVRPLLLFALLHAAAAGWTSLAPSERFPGSGTRLVYLHGAWVRTALIGLGAASLAGAAGLAWSLAGARQVMHTPSPIFSSESVAIRVFFMGLLILRLLVGWQLTRWLRDRAG